MWLVPAGMVYYAWPGICKHFGWDAAKLCGPTTMARNGFPEGLCCFGHPKGSPLHNTPKVAGKPFAIGPHYKELQKLNLVGFRPELKAMKEGTGKPEGAPRKIGHAMVYPVPHFA